MRVRYGTHLELPSSLSASSRFDYLVIVHDLHVIGIAIFPCEAHSELIIDPNAVLSFTIAFERFQPIGWRYAQIVQRFCSRKHGQLAHGSGFDVDPSPYSLAFEQIPCSGAAVGFDHYFRAAGC